MTHFLDSSAVVGAYAREAGPRSVSYNLGDAPAVSRLAELEIVSSLARLSREYSLSSARRDAAIEAFIADLAHWIVVEITPEVTARARELLLRHALRASDALQLASALVVHERLPDGLEAFVTFDKRLADAARRERMVVIDN